MHPAARQLTSIELESATSRLVDGSFEIVNCRCVGGRALWGARMLHTTRRDYPGVLNPAYDELMAAIWGIEHTNRPMYEALSYAAGVPAFTDLSGRSYARLAGQNIVE